MAGVSKMTETWQCSNFFKIPKCWAACGSDHELLIAKFRLKLKKVGKTTRPFRYDLNQIPYNYTMEVTNRFKGLDLIEYLKKYGRKFMTLYSSSDQDHPQEKEMQKGKMVVWVGLKNSSEKKRLERQRRKGKRYPFECRVPKNSRRDKKAFLSDQCKEIEENNRMGKTRDLFRKIRDTKGTFHARWAQ